VGAEDEMATNAAIAGIAQRILDTVHRFEGHVKMYGADLSTGEPNQGNMEAGLSTLEEKSLGCIRKIGSRPIVDVIEYADIPSTEGADADGLAELRCTVRHRDSRRRRPGGRLHHRPRHTVWHVDRTGHQGYVQHAGIPTRMEDTADLNAGTILDGEETIAETGRRLFDLVLQVANGSTTKAEMLGENQCQIWRTTLTL
jgi:altronate dehydratase large subunit